MSAMERVGNQFIINLVDLLHDQHNFYIVTDLAKEGDLLQYFCDLKESRLEEKQVKTIAK